MKSFLVTIAVVFILGLILIPYSYKIDSNRTYKRGYTDAFEKVHVLLKQSYQAGYQNGSIEFTKKIQKNFEIRNQINATHQKEMMEKTLEIQNLKKDIRKYELTCPK